MRKISEEPTNFGAFYLPLDSKSLLVQSADGTFLSSISCSLAASRRVIAAGIYNEIADAPVYCKGLSPEDKARAWAEILLNDPRSSMLLKAIRDVLRDGAEEGDAWASEAMDLLTEEAPNAA